MQLFGQIEQGRILCCVRNLRAWATEKRSTPSSGLGDAFALSAAASALRDNDRPWASARRSRVGFLPVARDPGPLGRGVWIYAAHAPEVLAVFTGRHTS